LLLAAVSVVVQLKDALNTVWEVEARKKAGIWQFVRTYLVSLAGVLAIGFLLMVSLLSMALSASGKYLSPHLPEAELHTVGSITSFGVITLLFAMMFKRLPDTSVRGRDVWLGAAITAALATASLVVLLIWIYYSSQIVLMGALCDAVSIGQKVFAHHLLQPDLRKQGGSYRHINNKRPAGHENQQLQMPSGPDDPADGPNLQASPNTHHFVAKKVRNCELTSGYLRFLSSTSPVMSLASWFVPRGRFGVLVIFSRTQQRWREPKLRCHPAF
jgi:Virulence factor BrkB